MQIRGIAQMTNSSSVYRSMMRNIIPYHDFIVTGNGWYPIETYNGNIFRWVTNDAEIIIGAPSGKISKICVELEAGPSLGRTSFMLDVLDGAGKVVAQTGVVNREKVSFDVPLHYNETAIFRLHVDSDDLPVPGDSRIMNFRVFSLGWSHLME